MKRQAIHQLTEWKNRENHKPLILQGARQVGKTWLLKEFGKTQYKNTVYITFENNPEIQNIFSYDLNPKRILQEIELFTGIKIFPKETLIIFDEIQECPKALTSLKYFNENVPEYDITAAGSLLGVTLHQGTSFPVGKVEFMMLYPLNFKEFLEATGEERFIPLIENCDFERLKIFKDKLTRLLRYYFYIGGMPEAVQDFVNNENFFNIRKIHKEILNSYDSDFSKHINNNLVEKIKLLWYSIPSQLAKENKKFIYGAVKKGARANDFELALAWLRDCGLIHKIHRVKEPAYPIKFYEDFNSFKLFISDIGLFCTLSGVDSKILINDIKIFEEFNGALTEQYVLQQLKCIVDDVFYWSNDTSRAEIDFMIQYEDNIVPIEVKAGINLKAKSLNNFREKYKPKISVRTSLADYKKNEDLYDIPLFCISELFKIVSKEPKN